MRATAMIELYDQIEKCVFFIKREQEDLLPNTTKHRILWRMQYDLQRIGEEFSKYVASCNGPDFRPATEGGYGANMTFEEIYRLDKFEKANGE